MFFSSVWALDSDTENESRYRNSVSRKLSLAFSYYFTAFISLNCCRYSVYCTRNCWLCFSEQNACELYGLFSLFEHCSSKYVARY